MNTEAHLIQKRHHLHAHPELSGNEAETAKQLVQWLKQYKPHELNENIGGHGILLQYEGSEDGPTILFRADIDALPIQEINNFSYKSTVPKVAHKCGHDGHAIILLALAEKLSKNRPQKGSVCLLFQPAEETGEGAEAVMQDPRFASVKPDFVFALHNLPSYPLHEVVIKHQSFTAAVTSLTFKLHGKTAHAAEPENGINPALAISEILNQANELSNNKPEQQDFRLLTPIHVDMGSIDYGISAGYGEVRFTLRTWTEEKLNHLKEQLLRLVEETAGKHNIHLEAEESHHFAANRNHPDAVEAIERAASDNGLSLTSRPFPFKWGEDFGLFTQEYKGAMFGLGSGEDCPALHNPDYDFPDALISSGASMFFSIAQEFTS